MFHLPAYNATDLSFNQGNHKDRFQAALKKLEFQVDPSNVTCHESIKTIAGLFHSCSEARDRLLHMCTGILDTVSSAYVEDDQRGNEGEAGAVRRKVSDTTLSES